MYILHVLLNLWNMYLIMDDFIIYFSELSVLQDVDLG